MFLHHDIIRNCGHQSDTTQAIRNRGGSYQPPVPDLRRICFQFRPITSRGTRGDNCGNIAVLPLTAFSQRLRRFGPRAALSACICRLSPIAIARSLASAGSAFRNSYLQSFDIP